MVMGRWAHAAAAWQTVVLLSDWAVEGSMDEGGRNVQTTFSGFIGLTEAWGCEPISIEAFCLYSYLLDYWTHWPTGAELAFRMQCVQVYHHLPRASKG